jgi:hypothetical protein
MISVAAAACCMEEEEAKVAPSPAVSRATRTESGRPRSSIRFRTEAAIATSVTRALSLTVPYAILPIRATRCRACPLVELPPAIPAAEAPETMDRSALPLAGRRRVTMRAVHGGSRDLSKRAREPIR